MSFVLASAARATTGARSGQEDAFRLWPAEGVARPNGEGGGLLAVLADGMGGHTGGAVAGQTACSTFAEVFSAATTPYDARLQSALDASNEALAKGVEQNAALQGHGLHADRRLDGRGRPALDERRRLAAAALSLSRRHAPQCRPFAGLVPGRAGAAEPHHVQRGQATTTTATRCARHSPARRSTWWICRGEPLELRAGDWILLASDGICSLEGDEIADVVYNFRQSTPAQMADGLIAAVVKKAVAGQDNTTVVAVRVDEASDASDAVTTRVMRRPGEEQELRSRRIGITGRSKTSPPKRSAARSVRSAVWLVAAAIFFLIFAATVLLRALQPTPVPASGTAAPHAAAARRGDGARAPEPADGRYTRARWPEGRPAHPPESNRSPQHPMPVRPCRSNLPRLSGRVLSHPLARLPRSRRDHRNRPAHSRARCRSSATSSRARPSSSRTTARFRCVASSARSGRPRRMSRSSLPRRRSRAPSRAHRPPQRRGPRPRRGRRRAYRGGLEVNSGPRARQAPGASTLACSGPGPGCMRSRGRKARRGD